MILSRIAPLKRPVFNGTSLCRHKHSAPPSACYHTSVYELINFLDIPGGSFEGDSRRTGCAPKKKAVSAARHK